MSLIHNERTKLLATIVNNVATAVILGGVVTPIIALSYGVSATQAGVKPILLSLSWLSIGSGLHWMARRILGRMRE